jgi:drug/metabolite transporter (DMT)-like permease
MIDVMVTTSRPLPVPRLVPEATLALAAVYVIWGSTYYVVGLALQVFPPMLLAGTRLTLAGGALYAILRWWSGAPAPTARQWRASAQLGVWLLVLGHGAVVFAQQWVPSSTAALASASIPLWAVAWAWLGGNRPTRSEGAALSLGLAGMAVLHGGEAARGSPLGMVLLLAAAASWAYGSVRRGRLGALEVPAGLMAPATQMLVAGPVLLLLGLARGEWLRAAPSAPGIAALAYLVVFGSIVAFSAYNYLLSHVRPALATSNSWVNPIFAVALGAGVGGEPMGLGTVVGGGLVLGSVWLLLRRR